MSKKIFLTIDENGEIWRWNKKPWIVVPPMVAASAWVGNFGEHVGLVKDWRGGAIKLGEDVSWPSAH